MQRSVKIVDLSGNRRVRQPTWLVRRAAEILIHNADQLGVEELQDIAHLLMTEAGSRLVSGEER